MKLDAATISQNRAAAPDVSTWLSANAGSGKTRVLTDRVARLLLDGVPPQNIVCLTYTKAAASEMQNRLFERLGDWAMKADGELAEDLQRMGVDELHDPARLAQARRLFARAIETPGGLKIQTIHAFCASLLRQFPLEAGVSPAFAEMDEPAAERLRGEVVDMLAESDAAAVDDMARHFTGEDLGDLTGEIVRRARFFGNDVTRANVLGWYGVPGDLTENDILRTAFVGGEALLLQRLSSVLQNSDKKTDLQAAGKLRGCDFSRLGLPEFGILAELLLTGAGAKVPFGAKAGKFPTKDCRAILGAVCDDLDDLMHRVEQARPMLMALRAADKSVALHRFARAFLPVYAARKEAAGWLDFDDLIDRTERLLTDPAVAQWVMYRLDGRIDHILVDEAQDTSPAQWRVVERLAEEFTAGTGARGDVLRTIFVVGDQKQSIYSFQGADPEEFERMRDVFRQRMENASLGFQQRDLEYSFRSSAAILTLVDEVFNGLPEMRADARARHRAFWETLPGRVDWWPAVAKAERRETTAWYEPLDLVTEDHHDVVLARRIARHIADCLETETIPLPKGGRRKVRAGDFLILVRRRSTLFAEIIRACKALELPVAGADRLKLGAELAVKDLAAVLAFLATPEDDLSLAAALRSPLFAWSEGDLYDLAAERGGAYLWAALRKAQDRHPETLAILNDLRDQSDYLRPYDLIERLLTRHDGRRRLLARLGPEAEDGIDSLLSQALSYEQREIPSLTGFLTWLQTEDVEIKRQLDNAGDQIRVMTVHGAKGLESPVVILPDTAKRQVRQNDEIVPLPMGAAWKPPATERPEAVEAALEDQRDAQRAEDLRLLYVAMTRAETWLIVAGAGDTGEDRDSWHSLVGTAIRALDPDPLETPVGDGLRYSGLDWTSGALEPSVAPDLPASALPDWIRVKVRPPEARDVLRPSDMEGPKVLPSETSISDAEHAARRGTQIHRLLEHLPGVPRERHLDAASAILTTGQDAALPSEIPALLAEAQKVLFAGDFDWLFAPDVLSEVNLAADLPGQDGCRMLGTIDKLVVAEGRVAAIDFKTNRVVPDRPEDTPLGLLRQMGAYAAALAQIYPDARIETAILWTVTPSLMWLPHEIVRDALHSLPTS